MIATANKEQLNRLTQGKLGLLKSRRLTNEERQTEGRPEPQQNNVPTLEEDWVQGNLAAFHAKMSFTHCISAARSHPLVKLWMRM